MTTPKWLPRKGYECHAVLDLVATAQTLPNFIEEAKVPASG